MYLGHRGVWPIPERLKDAELEVSKTVGWGFHGREDDQGNTT
jgi:hypothetical protein